MRKQTTPGHGKEKRLRSLLLHRALDTSFPHSRVSSGMARRQPGGLWEWGGGCFLFYHEACQESEAESVLITSTSAALLWFRSLCFPDRRAAGQKDGHVGLRSPPLTGTSSTDITEKEVELCTKSRPEIRGQLLTEALNPSHSFSFHRDVWSTRQRATANKQGGEGPSVCAQRRNVCTLDTCSRPVHSR